MSISAQAKNFMLEIIFLKSASANAMQTDVQSRTGGLAMTIASAGLGGGLGRSTVPHARSKIRQPSWGAA